MRKHLVFVSTRFLFPIDSGGKIRTTQILRGMKGGDYEITLLSPAMPEEAEAYRQDLESVCDHFEYWPAPRRGAAFHYTRIRHLLDRRPIPIVTDWSEAGCRLIERVLARGPDVVVFDFLHAAVLAPPVLPCPSVLFTHNVEAEIFKRHIDAARSPLMRALWKNQHAKMSRFERDALRRFDVVVAVSDRDAEVFRRDCEVEEPFVIPTGVDLDFFQYQPPSQDDQIVFCGSMDWLPNQDAIQYFMESIWPHIARLAPQAKMKVVGRAPPQRLVEQAARRGLPWHFTGFVDDVRDEVAGAAVNVIPIRVGGGTRLKAYEALAMGTPVVSTTVGVEGLPLEPGRHYLVADTPEAFAQATVELMRSPDERLRLARNGREYVEAHFSHRVAAEAFARACNLAVLRARESRTAPARLATN